MLTKAKRQQIYDWIRAREGQNGVCMETQFVSGTDYDNIRQRITKGYPYATYKTIERKGDYVRMRICIK